MKKKILVLGSGGMAGHVIATYLSENGHDVTTISAHNRLNDSTILLDVTDSKSLHEYLSSANFDVIINCVGMLVGASDNRKDLACYLNSYLPHQLEEILKNTNTKLIHLSTDCVFSGKNPPYTETSIPNGELFYDRSKALGEVINKKDLTFRMSIIGPDTKESGIGLFNWFCAQSGSIKGYSKVMWTGVTTIELAKAIGAAIEQDLIGLYHLVPKDNISKYDLLSIFKQVFDRGDLTITPDSTIVLDKTLINTRDDFNFRPMGYNSMVKEMKAWINNHPELYQHYEKKS